MRLEFGHDFWQVDTAGWMQRVKVKDGPTALSAMHARRNIQRAHLVALVLDAEEVWHLLESCRSKHQGVNGFCVTSCSETGTDFQLRHTDELSFHLLSVS